MQNVIEEIQRSLQEERTVVIERITSGNAADFAEYRNWAGQLLGIETALRRVADVEQRVMQED